MIIRTLGTLGRLGDDPAGSYVPYFPGENASTALPTLSPGDAGYGCAVGDIQCIFGTLGYPQSYGLTPSELDYYNNPSGSSTSWLDQNTFFSSVSNGEVLIYAGLALLGWNVIENVMSYRPRRRRR